MATDDTPYEGMALIDSPTTVVVAGHVVAAGGRLVDDTPRRRALHAEPVDLGALARTAPPVRSAELRDDQRTIGRAG